MGADSAAHATFGSTPHASGARCREYPVRTLRARRCDAAVWVLAWFAHCPEVGAYPPT
jgi:hypothetical protein